MWSLDSVVFSNFEPQPSVKASLEEFILDLKRIAPFHSGFSAKLEKMKSGQFEFHIMVECGTYYIEQTVQSEHLFEILYFAFQSVYAKILEQENSKVQALNTSKLGTKKRQVS